MRTETNCVYVLYKSNNYKTIKSKLDWFKSPLNFYIQGGFIFLTKPEDNPGHEVFTPVYKKGIREFDFMDNGSIPAGKYYLSSNSTALLGVIDIFHGQTYYI